MNIDPLVAIDVHTHVEQDGRGCFSLDQELLDASARYFRADQDRTPTVAAIAEHYRARNMAAVVFTVDAASGTGHPSLSSEEILDAAAEFPDVLIPFGSVDPHGDPVPRVKRLVAQCPRYFPPQLVRAANTMLREKVLFGSDFPVITRIAGSPTSPTRRSRTRCAP